MKTDLLKTEEAITLVKETFSLELSRQLRLIKVSSPIAVMDGTGINDDLNGVERPVIFPVKGLQDRKAVIVQSLAKWKRIRLKELGMEQGEGIITDMKALRPDEDFSRIHSIYVDQWDWEKPVRPEQRILKYLKESVRSIYEALKATEKVVNTIYPEIGTILPEEIRFIHSEELLRKYPHLSPRERETEIAKEYGAVFIIGIGNELSNGLPHDGRAPDYDDWSTVNEDGYSGLNGDIIFWNPVLESAFEISSMGIRVDKNALLKQLKLCSCLERTDLYFHKLLLSDKIPLSIGGGIGQSRVCMFMLRKSHIAEVQVSIWPDHIMETHMLNEIQIM
ncbi:MAG: aspartate--ammonia ligase [Bacteroidales bacterium]|nr:aspartate--ammonia ligase [Bacteroidales bacterium]